MHNMAKLLLDYANYLQTDDANTDIFFIYEGMTFKEVMDLMDHVTKAIREYVEREKHNLTRAT